MKKNLIALMMSIVMVVGSISGSSVFAAETTDESSTTKSAIEETADEELVVPEIADGESVALEEQEEASKVTEQEQTEGVQETVSREGGTNDYTGELAEPESEELSVQKEDIDIIETDEPEQGEEDQNEESAGISNNIAQAIWTEGNETLTFYYGPLYKAGDSFRGEKVYAVSSGEDVTDLGTFSPEWGFGGSEWALYATSVIFDSSFLAVHPTSTNSWFNRFEELSYVDLSGLDTSQVTDMTGMFHDCKNLTNLDVSRFDTSKVTDMAFMFCGCNRLTSLDLSGFDTSSVTNMCYMFYHCLDLASLDVSRFDTSKVTDMDSMFADCKNLTSLDVSGFDTGNVEELRNMFYGCESLASLDLSGFSPGRDIRGMFFGCDHLETIYCEDSKTDWSGIKGSEHMFIYCSALVGVDENARVAYDEDKTDASMAKSASLGGYFTPKSSSSVVDVAQAVWTKDDRTLIFYYGPQVSVGEEFKGETVTEVWSGASVTDSGSDTPVWNATLSNVAVNVVFDTSFSAVRPKSLYRWFYGFHSLGRISLTGLDTSDVVNMRELFSSCDNLINVDIKGFDTSNVEDMSYMFDGCVKLRTIYCIDSTTDWSKITLSNNMFRGCMSLLGVDHAARIVYNEERTDGSMAKAAGLGGYFSCYYKNDEMAIGPYTPNDMYGFKNPTTKGDLNIYKDFFTESKAQELFDAYEKEDHGMCSGMVVTAMASLLRDTPRVSSYNVSSLYDIKLNSQAYKAAMKNIKYGFALFYSFPVRAALWENWGNLQGLYESVLDFANGNIDKPVFIEIGKEPTFHALWGLGISENTPGLISIDVYDCNNPGEICKLYLRKKNDRITGWEYTIQEKTLFQGSEVWDSGDSTDVKLTFCSMFCDYFVERPESVKLSFKI